MKGKILDIMSKGDEKAKIQLIKQLADQAYQVTSFEDLKQSNISYALRDFTLNDILILDIQSIRGIKGNIQIREGFDDLYPAIVAAQKPQGMFCAVMLVYTLDNEDTKDRKMRTFDEIEAMIIFEPRIK